MFQSPTNSTNRPSFSGLSPLRTSPFLEFRKARQYDFAFHFVSHCPFAEEYSSLFLSFAAVLFTSLTLNALLTTWCSGQTALFLSLLAKTGPAYLPTALSVASRPPFSFQQARYAQVFPLKLAPSCTLFAGLGNANKSAISLLFSSYLTLALSLPPCSLFHLSFYLNLCPKLFSLFSSSIKLQWVPGHSFLPDDDAANILSHLNSSTHRFLRFPPSNVCFYVMLVVISLAFAATDTAFC